MECVLCTNSAFFFGLTECEHNSTCSLCWYRLRAILKKNSCPVCRQDCKQIFIISDQTTTYESILTSAWGDSFPGFLRDDLSEMYFSDKSELNRLISFRKLKCKMCMQEFKSAKDFKLHMGSSHFQQFCELCLQHNKLFMSEQEIYDGESYRGHLAAMHTKCNVCNNYFYDGSQLIAHIKSQHHFCEFCPVERRSAYLDYHQLQAHYRQMHYLCNVNECKESRHIAFGKYEDYKEHYKLYHPGIPIPMPAFGFKVKGEEEEEVQDINAKKPVNKDWSKIRRDEMDFPALAPPTSERRILDYSRVINKPPVSVWVQPQPMKKNEKKPNTSNPVVRKRENQMDFRERSPQKDFMEPFNKAFDKINNGHMPADEFIAWFRMQDAVLDNNMISLIRNKINSNSDREKIIFVLQNSKSKQEPKREIIQNFEEIQFRESFPMEEQKFRPMQKNTPVKNNIPQQTLDTISENFMILNAGLINNKIFAMNLLEFVHESFMDQVIQLIQEKLPRHGEILQILQSRNQLKKQQKPDFPTLSTKAMVPKPESMKKNFENTIKENLGLLNLDLITVKEFTRSCKEIVPIEHQDLLIEMIRKEISKKTLLNSVISELQSGQPKSKFKVINLPPEPKRINYRK